MGSSHFYMCLVERLYGIGWFQKRIFLQYSVLSWSENGNNFHRTVSSLMPRILKYEHNCSNSYSMCLVEGISWDGMGSSHFYMCFVERLDGIGWFQKRIFLQYSGPTHPPKTGGQIHPTSARVWGAVTLTAHPGFHRIPFFFPSLFSAPPHDYVLGLAAGAGANRRQRARRRREKGRAGGASRDETVAGAHEQGRADGANRGKAAVGAHEQGAGDASSLAGRYSAILL